MRILMDGLVTIYSESEYKCIFAFVNGYKSVLVSLFDWIQM